MLRSSTPDAVVLTLGDELIFPENGNLRLKTYTKCNEIFPNAYNTDYKRPYFKPTLFLMTCFLVL